jgi:DMSO/TMAO reductase YedYZ molybdopterin-dependent catalytic subunit
MKRLPRRDFMKTGGVAVISSLLPLAGCSSNDVDVLAMPTAPNMDIPAGATGTELATSPITPNDRFYLQSINGQNYDPDVNGDNWRLTIDGLVGAPITNLSYGDLISMPLQRDTVTLQCIGNWIGGPLVGNAEWGGTPLRNLLEPVGVQNQAVRLKFYSVDGYTTSIPLDRAVRDNVLLTWEMNGETLPSKHGFPVRLINPGHYGQKMPKWITRIELIDNVHLGYWESLPKDKPFKWSDDAVATVNSRIDAPLSIWDDVKDPGNGGVTFTLQTIRGNVGEDFIIHGIAMAGERTVERVEVSTDGGFEWQEAHITTRKSPNIWVTWGYHWAFPESGRYEILARATDDMGEAQPATDTGVDLYDGRTGYHRVPVNVVTS